MDKVDLQTSRKKTVREPLNSTGALIPGSIASLRASCPFILCSLRTLWLELAHIDFCCLLPDVLIYQKPSMKPLGLP